MKSKILWWVQRGGCGRPVARFARLALVVSFICSLLAASASAAPFVYVVTLSQQFGTIDLATGQFTPIGSPTPDGMSNLVWWNGSLLSMATTGANAGYLVKINPATGDETVLRAITYNGQPLGFNAFDLAKVRWRSLCDRLQQQSLFRGFCDRRCETCRTQRRNHRFETRSERSFHFQ